MKHTTLGRTGLRVSRLCLGTMTFGLQCEENESHRILDRAFEGGITFIDTADVYPLGGDLGTVGRTEEIVGRWMQGRRDEVIVATKCSGAMSDRPWDRGNSRKHIVSAIDASLRRLGTDYVDLYQLHAPDPATPIDETLGALDDVVRSGKARYIGCSNFPAYQVARAIGRSEVLGTARFDSVQPRHNLLFRQFERELFPLCQEEGIGVIPYNPLAGGMLTGKHSNREDTGGGRFELGTAGGFYKDRYWHDAEFDAIEQLRGMAADAGITMAEMAIGWSLATPAVTAPIVGASRPEQLDDALRAIDTPLEPDLIASLDKATKNWRHGDAKR